LNKYAKEQTKDEYAKKVVYWVTQRQFEPENIKLVAHLVGFRFPKLFKKNLLDFKFELICLFSAIALIATKEYLKDKPNLFEMVINEVYRLLCEAHFPLLEYAIHHDSWKIHIVDKCNKYVYECKSWNPKVMAGMFIENLLTVRSDYETHVSLSMYLQSFYLTFQNNFFYYKIINAEHFEF